MQQTPRSCRLPSGPSPPETMVTTAFSMAIRSASTIASGSSPTEDIPFIGMPTDLKFASDALSVSVCYDAIYDLVSYGQNPRIRQVFHVSAPRPSFYLYLCPPRAEPTANRLLPSLFLVAHGRPAPHRPALPSTSSSCTCRIMRPGYFLALD